MRGKAGAIQGERTTAKGAKDAKRNCQSNSQLHRRSVDFSPQASSQRLPRWAWLRALVPVPPPPDKKSQMEIQAPVSAPEAALFSGTRQAERAGQRSVLSPWIPR